MSAGAVDGCKRHKWSFLRNVEVWRIGPLTGRMTLRGLYRCDCGQRKYGVYRHV